MIFVLQLVNVVYYIDCFLNIELHFHTPGCNRVPLDHGNPFNVLLTLEKNSFAAPSGKVLKHYPVITTHP